jgi:tRNA (guanine26-N2/guanine27-N2)-dimethyltransferase
VLEEDVFQASGLCLSFSFPTATTGEGAVEFVVPKLQAFAQETSTYAPSRAPVFYNPAMALNRHLAVLALQVFRRLARRQLTVCEPMTGCGVRGLRLAKEVEGVEKVVINDINAKAHLLAKLNVKRNKLTDTVSVDRKDANFLLSSFAAPRKRFDYVDLDPFGSPMPYLDSTLRALKRNSLLGLTATDLAPLCGVHPKACVRKYGGRPLRTSYSRELAVRLVAGALAKTAAKHSIGVKIVFSHSSAHYVRLYATVGHGAKKANSSLENLGYVSHCFACFHRQASVGIFQWKESSCPECGHNMDKAGPLWIGRIVDEQFVASMEREAKFQVLRRKSDIRNLLGLTKGEANAPITYYSVDRICDKLGWSVPSVRSVAMELQSEGHKTNPTHFKTQGLKTAASAKEVKQAIQKSI